MGIELNVLVGHSKHDLLFVATQVARAAGLKKPSNAVGNYKQRDECEVSMIFGDVFNQVSHAMGDLPRDPSGKCFQMRSTMFPEADVYRMLLAGKAPQSEPFRKWVTEEVLPTIRKTGSYSAESSTNPIAQGVAVSILTSSQGLGLAA